MTEQERQMDILGNPNICNYHNFTFDYVYGPEATQKFIYENTAKTAVVSVLQVTLLIFRGIMQLYQLMDRLVLERHSQWKDFLTVLTIQIKESYLAQWKRFSNSLNKNLMTK